MNSNHKDGQQSHHAERDEYDAREVEEARLTAYALGQLDAREQAEVEAILAGSESARQFVDETAALAGHVREACRQGPAPTASAALREAVQNQLQSKQVRNMSDTNLPTPVVRKRSWGSIAARIAVAACLLAAVVAMLMPAGQRARKAARRSSVHNNLSQLGRAYPEFHEPVPMESGIPPDSFDKESPTLGTEQYDPIRDNRFLTTAKQPLSTFSIDVDTASYANVRRFLREGRLPPRDAVRIEEMVNYFRYDYSPPTGSVPFAVDMEVAQCPWRPENRLLRIGIKGREIDRSERGPSNLVFLLDVSGSMADRDKLPLVVEVMKKLVDQLTEDDRVAIVTYANGTGVRLPSARGNEKERIKGVLDSLNAGGSTNGGAGIQLAYQQAEEHFIKKGTNRVILCTDGDLNVGVTSDDDLVRLIQQKAKSGVFLSVLGFGTGNLKDGKLEKIADKGNGVYAYIDSLKEGHRVLVEQMTGSLITIAKDVKLQVEFNPAEVAAYRLVGYENRVMANRDFHDDRKDAGEIGAGHTVTALYEVVPAGAKHAGEDGETTLKYQRVPQENLTEQAKSGEMLTLRVRYKEPDADESSLLEFTAKRSDARFGKASADFRFAAAVAAFGMILRESPHRGNATLAAVEEFTAGALGKDANGDRAEFLGMVRAARNLASGR